jgi:hypothetical protein
MTAERRGPFMRRIFLLHATVVASMVLAVACGASSGSTSSGDGGSSKAMQGNTAGEAYSPNIDRADFTTRIDNKYFPLKPGTTFVYKGRFQGSAERDEMAVTHDTRRVMGVKCLVASDRVTEDGKLIEQTYDWYAQDKVGNVWYFGEHVTEYKNGEVTGHEGSWESGVEGAEPGIAMPDEPRPGDTYRQEYSKGVAEDKARVVRLDGSATVPYGSYDNVLVTEEFTPLEKNVVERQYYVAGVGDIVEATVKGEPERIELVDVKHG